MFDAFSATNLANELRASQRVANKRLESMRKLTKKYGGGSNKDL